MLLDTSGLVCCFDADDHRHEAAMAFYDQSPVRVTHNYVLAEFVAVARSRRLPREKSLAFAARALKSPHVEVAWVDVELHQAAMRLIETQLDKAYSLCDAVSFVLMRQRGIVDALTTDHHFEQAGFRRLLPRNA